MPSSLLIVCSAFAPSLMIGGRRCERIAGHFVSRGWSVAVVAPEPMFMPPISDDLRVPAGCEMIYTRALMPRISIRHGLARLGRLLQRGGSDGDDEAAAAVDPVANLQPPVRGAMRRAIPFLLDATIGRFEFPDEYAGWVPYAVKAVRGRSFDVVLASMPSFSAAIAGRRISAACGARLVLDYRDPWTDLLERKPEGQARANLSRHRRSEDACLARADLVVAVTDTIARWLAPHCKQSPLFVPNGFDVAAASGNRPLRRSGEPLRMIYAGSLSYGRTLEPVMAAMARAGAADAVLDYVGEDGAVVAEWARAAGIPDRVRLHGPRPHGVTSEMIRSSDAAIVVVSENFAYALPGKISEILGYGPPLLLLAPAGCDADRLVGEHGLGWSHSEDDVDGIVRSLTALDEGRIPARRDLEQWTASHTMKRLEDAIGEMLAAEPVRAPREGARRGG